MFTISLLLTLLPFFGPAEAPGPGRPPVRQLNKTLMLQLVNEVRKKGCQCGDTYFYPTTPLVWSDRLATAAQVHTDDMYQKDYFSHAAPDGSRAGTRIERAGYNWKAYGENIAHGYKTEREVVEGWISSPTHCKNLMGRQFRELGAARTGTYWAQEFGDRLK